MARLTLLRISVILGLLAGFALSPKLWISARLYPLTPVWNVIRPMSPLGSEIVFFALIALLLAVAAVPRREIFVAAFALIALLVLQDQSRWQPWFYQYVFMLLAIALAGRDRPMAALNTCCLIVAATYIWSGLAKLNPIFIHQSFPDLVNPFLGGWPAPARRFAQLMAFAAPPIEFGIGVALLTARWRRAAVFCGILMHVFILIAIGPLGQRHNIVVWPWNAAMIAFLLILFYGRAVEPAPKEIVWGGEFAFQKVALVLFGILPALSFVNRWDHYLSAALYSGNRNSGIIYVSDQVFEQLPDELAAYVYEDKPDRNGLDVNDWSLGELNVPCYPEVRIFRNVARKVCGYSNAGDGVELAVEGQLALTKGDHQPIYHCSDLP